MTYEDVEYCNHLINEINKYKKEVKNFDDLLKRVNEITTMYSKEIEIKINEGYTGTPVTSVSLENFIKFIREERKNKKELMNKVAGELFSFYPNAVEIVRCKDCSSFMSCNRTEGPDWFCPKGK